LALAGCTDTAAMATTAVVMRICFNMAPISRLAAFSRLDGRMILLCGRFDCELGYSRL
jgi:hypothetical protein